MLVLAVQIEGAHSLSMNYVFSFVSSAFEILSSFTLLYNFLLCTFGVLVLERRMPLRGEQFWTSYFCAVLAGLLLSLIFAVSTFLALFAPKFCHSFLPSLEEALGGRECWDTKGSVPPFCFLVFCSRLKHPNVLRFIGYAAEPGFYAIVTDLLDRGSLYDILHNKSIDLPWKRRLKMVRVLGFKVPCKIANWSSCTSSRFDASLQASQP